MTRARRARAPAARRSRAGRCGCAARSCARRRRAARRGSRPCESVPTMNSVEPPPMSMTTVGSEGACPSRSSAGHRAEERELRLFLAGQDARVEAILRADRVGELAPVGGVAHRRGEHGEVGYSPSAGCGRRSPYGTRRARQHPRTSLPRQRPQASTPAPSRVTIERRTSSATCPSGVTSAISSRVELVPMSTTATRIRA